jgi:DNA-binding CsgD family transcriptional regulator
VFFHAKVRLYYDPDERLSLTLKRRIRLGPYEPADIARLDAIVPELRAVFRMARCVLDAEASGLVRALRHRGDPVFELGTSGRVLRVHGDDAERSGLLVRNRRLVAADRLAQPQLARAIAAALQPPQRGSLAVITDERGERRFLRIMPVTGGARDVFIATAAIAVLIQPTQPAPDGLPPDGIRGAFGLTVREAQIARLLADGLSLTEIAGRLLMRIGTARNHLKSIFEKSGATRQGELIALLCKLLP